MTKTNQVKWGLLIAVSLFTTSCWATDTKKDILGFSPGMTVQQMNEKLANLTRVAFDPGTKERPAQAQLSGPADGFGKGGRATCGVLHPMSQLSGPGAFVGCSLQRIGVLETDTLELKLTLNLDPIVLQQVAYKFESGLSMAEMIATVSSQFNATSTLPVASSCPPGAPGPASAGCGLVSDWDLGNGLSLRVSKTSAYIQSYTMLLLDVGIQQRDDTATQKRLHDVNVPTKF